MGAVKLLVCIGSALAIHAAAAVAVLVPAYGAPRLHVIEGTAIEVDELPPKPIETLEEPAEHLPIVVRPVPMRGAPHASIVAVAATASISSKVVPAPPPIEAHARPRFVMGGDEGGVIAQAPPMRPSNGDRTFAESDVTDRATLLSGPKPVYPSGALADGIELDAPLAFEIVVDTAGAVVSTLPLDHAGHGFDEAALAALRAFRFTPAKRDGELVRVRMRWTVAFHFAAGS